MKFSALKSLLFAASVRDVRLLLHSSCYQTCLISEKPYSHQGSIVTIKLSENTETVTLPDGNQQMQLVEMLFEMNYDTGHWRRLKRTRVVSKNGASTAAQKTA